MDTAAILSDGFTTPNSHTLTLPLAAFSAEKPNNPEEDQELKRLRFSNDIWNKYSVRWRFYVSAYTGGEDFATAENLFKHQRESQPDYDDRIKRLDNMNYCEPLVAFFTNFIFSESIDRSGGSAENFYKEFIKDVSKRGDTVDDFMRQVSDDMQIYGLSYVIVDTPALPGASEGAASVVSKQFENDNKITPYWVLASPLEFIDWEVDTFGAFTYVKRQQFQERVVNGQHKKYEVYTEFYPDRYEVTEVDITDHTKPAYGATVVTPNDLGEIPIRIARYIHNKKDPHVGLSFLRDFAYNNRRILNITSMLDEFLYRQCFNILAKEVDAAVPLREQEEGMIGTSNVMEYPKGAKTPSYITPPGDPAKILQDERGRIVTQMYLRASQDTMNELFNGEKSSGFSQAQSFSRTVPFISSRADALERLENDLMRLTLKSTSKEWDGKIKYKDRYELTNLTSALTQLQVLVRDFQIPSETFVKEELKRMIHEFDGKLPVETLAKIEHEIDAMDFKAWQAVQKEAFAGAPPTSPAAQQKAKKDVTSSLQEKEN